MSLVARTAGLFLRPQRPDGIVPFHAAASDTSPDRRHPAGVPGARRFTYLEVDMHDIKERLSILWIFALFNYLYADVIALWALLGSPPADTPHLGQLALAGSAVLMEIPIAMILASRLLPLRANRLANIIAGSIATLVNGFLTYIPPLVGRGRPPALPEY